ncbi:MAG: hypothetical protein AAFR98_12110 [Pseudomonadota bacterium]
MNRLALNIFVLSALSSLPTSSFAQDSCFKLEANGSFTDVVRDESSYDFLIVNRCNECVLFWLEPRKDGRVVDARVSVGNAIFGNPMAVQAGEKRPYRMTVARMSGTYGPATTQTEYCDTNN